MARSGASRAANALLGQLVAEGHSDEETLGLLARTFKDVALAARDIPERRTNLARALDGYRDAYARTGGYWSGINAATMALLLDRRDDASALADAVAAQCTALLEQDPLRSDLYWVLATLGEAALIKGAFADAEAWYARTAAAGRGRVGDLVSTRRNARLILRHGGHDTARIDACFAVPLVVVFAGHLIDRPDRRTPRFPSTVEPKAREAIQSKVSELRPGFAYASAACGGDILFLEAAATAGAKTHVVLPYNRAQFRQDSVDIVPDGEWSARYDRVLQHAAEIVLASDDPIGDMSYDYGFLMLDGSACVKADELETELVCLALWDGEAGDGPGGTAASIEHWRRAGRRIETIDLAALRAGTAPRTSSAPTIAQPEPSARPSALFEPQIVGMLFGDAKGFSRLTEPEIPLFVEHFLGAIASEIARAPSPPLQVNTWGDGLYLVFNSVGETGSFALALSDAVRRIDWRRLGFHGDISLRIGLHAGPAYACTDPVTTRRNYLGAHVSRAARIEPIAPPGEVYASGAFAALARANQVDAFRCDYVGQTPLAKGYGTFPTFVVRANAGR